MTAEVVHRSMSPQCGGEMHPACNDWSGCICTCHQVCQNPDCAKQCRSTYLIPGGMKVCAACFRAMAPPPGRTTPCENCGHSHAYRHPGHGDDRFLCPGCHRAAGHIPAELVTSSEPSSGSTPGAHLDVVNSARQATCPQCWAYPGRECEVGSVVRGLLHYKRYERANRRGAITDEDLADAARHATSSSGLSGFVYWPEETIS